MPRPTASPPPAADASEPAVDRRTLFVTDIAYDATAAAVQAAFEEVGPVRSCFLVGGAGAGKAAKHKGCGYVKFALAEDAARALAKLQGAPIAGRPVRVELARKRAPLEQRKRGRGKGGEGDEEGGEEEAGAAADGSGAAPGAPAPPQSRRPRARRRPRRPPRPSTSSSARLPWAT